MARGVPLLWLAANGQGHPGQRWKVLDWLLTPRARRSAVTPAARTGELVAAVAP